ncbi:intraflagellar transport protein 20 homolog [Ornithodoros turicata]|uniref:intraflagellar transport protein 20 homolog n=1 Tax=Ornithodoros turicata TaxID=34597 RepID=UPI00313A21B6
MASETLARVGLFVDELNKVRIVDPEVTKQTEELKDNCKEFVSKMDEFQSIVDKYINVAEKLAESVEHEKMKAIGARNLLKSVEKQREMQQQQLQALVLEKRIHLERLNVQYNALRREEAEQNETIEHFLMQR